LILKKDGPGGLVTSKLKVYFNEFNVPMDKTVYLPYVSGLLQAYAQSFPKLKEVYQFMPFLFIRDTPDKIVARYDDPFLAVFSVCIWNYELSLSIACKVKKKFPKCKIVFGGCHVNESTKEYPFVDTIIKGEGEKPFVELLGGYLGEEIVVPEYALDNYPSPYSLGLYDYLFDEYPDINFQAILESNRGCPFSCAFCFWGQGFDNKKIKFHSLDYIREEAQWLGRKKIKYVFMADANFGMYAQDYEVAKIYSEVKVEYGYPEKVRVCYGKNKEDMVFKTAKLLADSGMSKAITLARQSNNEAVLENIKRKNIKLGVYNNLQKKYHDAGIPTYTEIILGLPGESLETFKEGVEDILTGETQLFIYHCSILPNTDMWEPEYIKKWGIKTSKVPLSEVHGAIRQPDMVQEYEDIIIATDAMPMEDWIKAAVYSWETQLKYSFGIEDIPSEETMEFSRIAHSITQGRPRCQTDLRFGNVYWEPEELAFLRISLARGDIKGDLVQWAKEVVIWGRKSKMHRPHVATSDKYPSTSLN
jgi:radical SAM superfamily enzyme YgiQ (UPF0313 family)